MTKATYHNVANKTKVIAFSLFLYDTLLQLNKNVEVLEEQGTFKTHIKRASGDAHVTAPQDAPYFGDSKINGVYTQKRENWCRRFFVFLLPSSAPLFALTTYTGLHTCGCFGAMSM